MFWRLCIVAIPVVAAAQEGRELLPEERASLVEYAGRGATILDGWVQTPEGRAPSALAVVIYLPAQQATSNSCITTRLEFSGVAAEGHALAWEGLPALLTYLYWRDQPDCADAVPRNAIALATLVDSDTIDRVFEGQAEILSKIIQAFGGRNEQLIRRAALSSIGIEYNRLSELYMHRVVFSVSQCYSVSAYLRFGETLEVVDAGEIVC
jgi:hypothetical protein